MRFYKLVKSIDYVTYPSLIELKKINKSLGDSFSKFYDIIIAAIVEKLLEITPGAQWIIEKLTILSNRVNWSWLANSLQNKQAKTVVAMMLAIFLYFLLWAKRWFKSRFGSNKDTVEERKEIVCEFYKGIIPQLVSIKSIIQQHDESEEWDEDKRYLLLLQAKFEVTELIRRLNNLNVIEVNPKLNILSTDSRNVLDHIGEDVYLAILQDLLLQVNGIYSRLKNCNPEKIKSTLESLRAVLSTAKTYTVCRNLSSGNELYKRLIVLFDEVNSKLRQ